MNDVHLTPRLPGTAWRKLRKSIEADVAKLREGDITKGNTYAMLDMALGVLAKMDALEPGGAWDQPGALDEQGQIPAWLAYAGVPIEQVPDGVRESVASHRAEAEKHDH